MEKHCDVTLMYKNEKRNKTLSLCAKTTRDKKTLAYFELNIVQKILRPPLK